MLQGFTIRGSNAALGARKLPLLVTKAKAFLDKLPYKEVIPSAALALELGYSLSGANAHVISIYLPQHNTVIHHKRLFGSSKTIAELNKQLAEGAN